MKKTVNIVILFAFLSSCNTGMGEGNVTQTEKDEIAEVIATEKTFPSDTHEGSAPDASFLLRQATNRDQYKKLWNDFNFQERAPKVNFNEKNVLFFYLTESGSCPHELRGEDIQVNPNKETLDIDIPILDNTEGGCTADIMPRTFVIEITQRVGPFNSVTVRHIGEEFTVPIN